MTRPVWLSVDLDFFADYRDLDILCGDLNHVVGWCVSAKMRSVTLMTHHLPQKIRGWGSAHIKRHGGMVINLDEHDDAAPASGIIEIGTWAGAYKADGVPVTWVTPPGSEGYQCNGASEVPQRALAENETLRGMPLLFDPANVRYAAFFASPGYSDYDYLKLVIFHLLAQCEKRGVWVNGRDPARFNINDIIEIITP